MADFLSAVMAGLLLCLSLSAVAQEAPLPASPEAAQELLRPEEIDQLLAPIALYPDPLLADILMASTYPLEVVEAARWLQDPNNAALKGDALTEALSHEDWAPSVKALVAFPEVLRLMDSRLDWMQQLGNAYLAQPDDVMDSVQRLRRAAEEAGTLQSTPEQEVTTSGSTIIIQPVSPRVIYVPYYDPFVIYGSWPYPAYPPVYFPVPSIYLTGVVHAEIYFGVGIVILPLLWDWHHWDWVHHRLYINVSRFNMLNVGRPRVTHDVWRHEPFHRRGVIYPSQRLRERYRHTRTLGTPGTLRDYRGYPGVRPSAPLGRTAPAPARSQTRPARRQRTAPAARPAAPSRQLAPAPMNVQPRPAERRRATPQPGATVRRPQARPQRTTPTPMRVQPRVNRSQQRTLRNRAPAARPSPPAFQGIGRGRDVRIDSTRGRESRSTRSFNTAPRQQRPSGGQRSGFGDTSRRQHR